MNIDEVKADDFLREALDDLEIDAYIKFAIRTVLTALTDAQAKVAKYEKNISAARLSLEGHIAAREGMTSYAVKFAFDQLDALKGGDTE